MYGIQKYIPYQNFCDPWRKRDFLQAYSRPALTEEQFGAEIAALKNIISQRVCVCDRDKSKKNVDKF